MRRGKPCVFFKLLLNRIPDSSRDGSHCIGVVLDRSSPAFDGISAELGSKLLGVNICPEPKLFVFSLCLFLGLVGGFVEPGYRAGGLIGLVYLRCLR